MRKILGFTLAVLLLGSVSFAQGVKFNTTECKADYADIAVKVEPQGITKAELPALLLKIMGVHKDEVVFWNFTTEDLAKSMLLSETNEITILDKDLFRVTEIFCSNITRLNTLHTPDLVNGLRELKTAEWYHYVSFKDILKFTPLAKAERKEIAKLIPASPAAAAKLLTNTQHGEMAFKRMDLDKMNNEMHKKMLIKLDSLKKENPYKREDILVPGTQEEPIDTVENK